MELESIDRKTLQSIAKAIGSVSAMVCRLPETDISRGCGVLGPKSKCLWTKDGHRITFEMIQGGGFIASCSKVPDPEAPKPVT